MRGGDVAPGRCHSIHTIALKSQVETRITQAPKPNHFAHRRGLDGLRKLGMNHAPSVHIRLTAFAATSCGVPIQIIPPRVTAVGRRSIILVGDIEVTANRYHQCNVYVASIFW
jgi:hypothetical protein